MHYTLPPKGPWPIKKGEDILVSYSEKNVTYEEKKKEKYKIKFDSLR